MTGTLGSDSAVNDLQPPAVVIYTIYIYNQCQARMRYGMVWDQ